MKHPASLHIILFLGLLPALALAQGFGPQGKGIRKADAPELKANQPAPPAGFDVPRSGIARGKVQAVEFATKESGAYRAMIYTPPGLAPQAKAPVLYLLHGASGDENTWIKDIHADAILDNLYAAKKLMPMIVVMPSMRPVAGRDQAGANRDAKARAAMAFGEILLQDLIPWVESHYPALTAREHRALAGLSMGAGTALATALANSDKFAWVGAFSGAGRRWSEPRQKFRLLWLSVGDRDVMMAGGMVAAAAFLTGKEVPHDFHINSGGHEPKVWMNDLYYFTPLLFKP